MSSTRDEFRLCWSNFDSARERSRQLAPTSFYVPCQNEDWEAKSFDIEELQRRRLYKQKDAETVIEF
jgi:hypothetical protein